MAPGNSAWWKAVTEAVVRRLLTQIPRTGRPSNHEQAASRPHVNGTEVLAIDKEKNPSSMGSKRAPNRQWTFSPWHEEVNRLWVIWRSLLPDINDLHSSVPAR